MRESAIERYFTDLVKLRGGKAYKFVSPGNRGVPDRIVFFKGICHLVELKAPGGRLRPEQVVQHMALKKFDFDVTIISSKEQARLWVELNAAIAARMAGTVTRYTA